MLHIAFSIVYRIEMLFSLVLCEKRFLDSINEILDSINSPEFAPSPTRVTFLETRKADVLGGFKELKSIYQNKDFTLYMIENKIAEKLIPCDTLILSNNYEDK